MNLWLYIDEPSWKVKAAIVYIRIYKEVICNDNEKAVNLLYIQIEAYNNILHSLQPHGFLRISTEISYYVRSTEIVT